MRAHYPDQISTSLTVASPVISPPIPSLISTGAPSPRTPANDRSNSYSSRLRRTRENPLNYADTARKRVRTLDQDESFPSPDDDLGDYISTFSENHIPREDLHLDYPDFPPSHLLTPSFLPFSLLKLEQEILYPILTLCLFRYFIRFMLGTIQSSI